MNWSRRTDSPGGGFEPGGNMSMTDSIHPELGREVPVGSIDRELRQLWAEDEARTHASLINLAIYSEVPGSLERNSRAVRDLTREHACRAILIHIDRDRPEPGIRAWITAHCHLRDGHKSVCCEQIAFALTGQMKGRLRNTVFAHLSSDLPLTFWWQGELSPIFSERLYSLVDRFIIDAASWADPVAGFATILAALEDAPKLVVQDLEWTRTFQFRVSVAALFDDPLAQAAIPAIRQVSIRHHPAHRLAALQLLAWLATQARWSDGRGLELDDARRSGSEESFTFESRGGREVMARLVADEESAPIGFLGIDAGEVGVEVSREPGSIHLCRVLTAPGHCLDVPGPADPLGAEDLVAEQLSRGGKNSLYRKILPRFLALLAASGAGEKR